MAVQGNEPVDAGYFAEVEDLFFDALELPPDQRQTWLQIKCQDRQEIYTEVQTLLEAHIASDEFLSESPDLKGIAACPDLAGRRLGSYQVDREIAKGGMGRVYSADRVDGEYEQRVAIKVVELGNIEAELFRRERQTLANLEHPNIVTLLDGGTLEEGFPYLVMELVDGQAIDLYNIEHKLSRKKLLTLFCTLCEVVGRAHQQGVIHCDLKPANILVTDRGILKLLDFGISQTLIKTQDSQKDEIRSQALTPEYASPQRQEHQTPHITDDVYSLGIILGQLLIGESLPRVATELLVKKRYKRIDIEQMLQLIPSHELRMIIKKATHDEPEQRYQTADLLGDDLQNFLQEKPVEAISGGKSWQFYTFYKNLTRNRNFWGVLLASLLLLGGAAYFWNKQKVAEMNADAAAAAKKVMTDLSGVLSRTQPSIDVQAELTGLAIQNIEKTVDNAPDNIPAIHALTESLIRLGQLEGHPLYLNRGNVEEANSYFTAAKEKLDVLKRLVLDGGDIAAAGDDDINPQVVSFDLLRVKRMLAEVALYTGDKDSAVGQLHSLEKEFNQANFSLTGRRQILMHIHDLLSWANFNVLDDNYDVAEQYLQQSEGLIGQVATVEPELEEVPQDLKPSELRLNERQRNQRKKLRDEADRVLREKLEYLKEARYLKAFAAEQKGHIAFLKGDFPAAARHYLLIGDSVSVDTRLTPLLGRINTMRACIALKRNQPAVVAGLHSKIQQQYDELLREHPGSLLHQSKLDRLMDEALPIDKQLDCNAPKLVIFPFPEVSPPDQNDVIE